MVPIGSEGVSLVLIYSSENPPDSLQWKTLGGLFGHIQSALTVLCFYGDDLEKIDNLWLYIFVTRDKLIASSGWRWFTSALSCTSSSGVLGSCGPVGKSSGLC